MTNGSSTTVAGPQVWVLSQADLLREWLQSQQRTAVGAVDGVFEWTGKQLTHLRVFVQSTVSSWQDIVAHSMESWPDSLGTFTARMGTEWLPLVGVSASLLMIAIVSARVAVGTLSAGEPCAHL